MTDVYTYVQQQLQDDPSAHAVGHSAFGRSILAVSAGYGRPWALVHAAIHGREHITTPLVVAMWQAYKQEVERKHNQGIDLPCVHFVPLVNPDGALLCTQGETSAPADRRAWLAGLSAGDWTGWKANGNAVDCNVNFPAEWGTGQSNITTPAPANYIGTRAASESEVQCLMALTRQYRYRVSLSYHCKGEVVYYGFGRGSHAKQGHSEAQAVADYLGYTALTSAGSAGGYKDWHCLIDPIACALTIEVGDDSLSHPLPYSLLPELEQKHSGLLAYMVYACAQMKNEQMKNEKLWKR